MKIQSNVDLKPWSSYRIGGAARFFCEARNEEELIHALSFARHEQASVFILGGGTNLLFHDNGYDGFVIKPALMGIAAHGVEVGVGAGVLMSDLVRFTAERGLAGLEWAGGLPGTVGGAIRGNAGAFKGEIKDTLTRVRSIKVGTGEIGERANSTCHFGYRTSIFKELRGGELILSAVFHLTRGDATAIKSVAENHIQFRLSRHPMDYPNVGSIFKNVSVKQVPQRALAHMAHVIKTDPMPVIPTAYLISEAGLRGVSYGGAMISPKHPNFIVNTLGASSNDVSQLITLARISVKKKFGIVLEEEVERVA